jgi:hypothetical protein
VAALFPNLAHAEGISLKVNPSVLQMRTQVPSDVRAPFIIENQSNQSVKLKIGYKLFDPTKSQDGKVVFLDDPGSYSEIFNYIQVLDTDNTAINSLDLGPKQQKQLQVRVILPQNHPSADHYFSLVFLHEITPQTDQNSTVRDRKDQHTITTIQGGIAANVLLAVGQSETAQGYIEEFSSPIYLQSGPVAFSLKVKNTGLHYINPKGTITIKNVFGQRVGKVEIPSTAILAGTTRSLLDSNQLLQAAQPSPDAKAVWSEKFLLGLYSAELNIAMAAEGPTYNQTIRFFAFPVHIALGILLIITMAVVIYIKVKKRIS